ncbi:lactonase family protein [Spirosoma knui]
MAQTPSSTEILYVGTYSVRGSKGIYVFAFDRSTGTFSLRQTVDNPNSPSFLAIHPSGRFLYAVNEKDDQGDDHSGTVTAYAIDQRSGELTFINQQLTQGQAPCHISVHQSGRLAFVSNYGGGSLTVLPILGDGSLGEVSQLFKHTGKGIDEDRQDAPHVHSAIRSVDGRFLYVSDLGTDKIHIYALDKEQGKLSPHETPYVSVAAGSGPRLVAVHPKDQFAYSVKEMSSTVAILRRNVQTDTFELVADDVTFLPEDYAGERSGGDIHVGPTGRYLYVTNRGNNTLAVFSINDEGKLTHQSLQYTGGDQPRSFLVDGQGQYVWVGHQESDNITIFRHDAATGELTATGNEMSIPSPVCLVMHRLP